MEITVRMVRSDISPPFTRWERNGLCVVHSQALDKNNDECFILCRETTGEIIDIYQSLQEALSVLQEK